MYFSRAAHQKTTVHVEMSSVAHKILQEHRLLFISPMLSWLALWVPKKTSEKHREGRTVLRLVQERCAVSQWHWWAELGADWVAWHTQIAGYWEQSVNFRIYSDVSMGFHPYYLVAGAAVCAWSYSADVRECFF